MPREQLLLQFVDTRVNRFDEQQLLALFRDFPFPAVDRCDARNDVYTRGEPRFDELARERPGIEIGADRGDDDDRLQSACRYSATCDAASLATAWAARRNCTSSLIGIAIQPKRLPPPIEIDVGEMPFFDCCRSNRRISSSDLPSYSRTSAATCATTNEMSTPISPLPMPTPPCAPLLDSLDATS